MDDLISRQAALDMIHGTFSKSLARQRAEECIKKVPSAQPDIIRCKDCRHGVNYYHDGDCYCSNPKWGLRYFGGSWEFYCADAERQEE